jgi:hypothetical protein
LCSLRFGVFGSRFHLEAKSGTDVSDSKLQPVFRSKNRDTMV